MSNHVWVDPRIELVDVAGIQSYLEARGWQRQPYPGPELLVFGGPVDDDGEPIIQVLPSSEKMRDFRLRAEQLITALSVLEERPAVDILEDMLRHAPAGPLAEDGGKNGARTGAVPRSQP
jgi:hypothetical protein